jgi:hypothetical protein
LKHSVRYQAAATVEKTGAPAGAVLAGCGMKNQGLRLRIAREQEKGDPGPLVGNFEILDVGDNVHSEALREVAFRRTDAAEVVSRLRQHIPGCVNVANVNILAVEAP